MRVGTRAGGGGGAHSARECVLYARVCAEGEEKRESWGRVLGGERDGCRAKLRG